MTRITLPHTHHIATQRAFEGQRLIDRMAGLMVERHLAGLATTADDLIREGFAERVIADFGDRAIDQATRQLACRGLGESFPSTLTQRRPGKTRPAVPSPG